VTISWARQGDTLLARVSIHSAWRATAEAYVAHRLRRLRAEPRGFLQPCRALLEADSLVLGFARSARPPTRRAAGSPRVG
jgi:hypothetical protein